MFWTIPGSHETVELDPTFDGDDILDEIVRRCEAFASERTSPRLAEECE